jgi:hypothetical protein
MKIIIRGRLGTNRTDLESGGGFIARLRRSLGLASAATLAMAFWRLAYDLAWTDRFAITDGIFSHWQLWMGLTLVLQVSQSSLARFRHGGTAIG